MYKTLRILFCVLAVLGAAVTVFIFIYFKIWGILPLGVACVSAALMMFFKRKQENEEAAKNPTPVGDFITGKPEKKEEPLTQANIEADANVTNNVSDKENNI